MGGGAVLSLQNYKCHIKIDIVINNYSSYFLKSNKVFDQFDTDASWSLSKPEIKYACNCLGLKAWDIDEFFIGLDTNKDGEISLMEFKENLPSYLFKAMAAKLSHDGLIEGF